MLVHNDTQEERARWKKENISRRMRGKEYWRNENHYFAVHKVIIDSEKDHQWMLKPLGEVHWGTEYSQSLKVSFPRLLTN